MKFLMVALERLTAVSTMTRRKEFSDIKGLRSGQAIRTASTLLPATTDIQSLQIAGTSGPQSLYFDPSDKRCRHFTPLILPD
jgi:hypothetical protein